MVQKKTDLDESLLAPGLIRLFGREFKGLKLADEGVDLASNNPVALKQQINSLAARLDKLEHPDSKHAATEGHEDKEPRLARIYGFSYLGNYFKMANPPVLRVYGPGNDVIAGYEENPMDVLGVEFKNEDFVKGIRMWPADHLDVGVRIDITIGWWREILLDTDMSQETNVTSNSPVSRADVVGRDSGLVGRDSGLVGRDSGLVGRDSGFAGRPRR
jgi:hypothetical protein